MLWVGLLEISDKAREEILMHSQTRPTCVKQDFDLSSAEVHGISMLKGEVEGGAGKCVRGSGVLHSLPDT